jgi:sulfate adenylyltransferase subunit 2
MNHLDLMGLDAPKVWDTEIAFRHLNALRKANTKRAVERLLYEMKILAAELKPGALSDELARKTNQLLLSWALVKSAYTT